MPKPPRRPPSTRKTDATRDAIIDRAIVAKPSDPRQAGLFDEPLPKWIRPCHPTLVDKPPVGQQWVHEIKWDGYRLCSRNSGDAVARWTRRENEVGKRVRILDGAAFRCRWAFAAKLSQATPTDRGDGFSGLCI